MTELRWLLLLIGLVLIVGTLVYSQFVQRKQERNLFGEDPEQDPLLVDEHGLDDDYQAHNYHESADLAEYKQAQEDEQIVDEESESEQHIVVLHVISRQEQFDGQELKGQLEHLGLRHGKFDIYHRESLQNPDISLFSVANMFKPGAFVPDDHSSYQTKGISFFLILPGPPDAVTTFNEMLQTAKQLASKLDADVYDADRSTFTGQRAQLIRDEIINFMHKTSQA